MSWKRLLAVAALATLPATGASATGAGGLLAGLNSGQGESASAQTPVQLAQFSIQFGASDQTIRRSLRRDGYTDIEITYKGLTKARAEACRDGIRYRVITSTGGRVRARTKIGECRPKIDIEEARRVLQGAGYRRIDLSEQGGVPYVAIACKGPRKYRVYVNEYGELNEDRRLGPCREALQPADVSAKLSEEGYDRITFTDRSLPRYVAEACQNGRKYELIINRRGGVRRRNSIGRCAQPIRGSELPAVIAKLGFDRIEVFDDKLPRYTAEGCRGGERIDLVLNRFGDVVRQRKVGTCPPPMDEAQLVKLLADNGYTSPNITDRRNEQYIVEACEARDKVRIQFTLYGEVLDKRRIDTCYSPRLSEIADRVAGRGETKIFVEFCNRRNRRIRMELDEMGNPLGRERIGRCR